MKDARWYLSMRGERELAISRQGERVAQQSTFAFVRLTSLRTNTYRWDCSVFEMVSRSRFPRGSDTDAMVSEDFGSPPFLLVDIVAVDAHGDVAFPPFRIQRAAMIG